MSFAIGRGRDRLTFDLDPRRCVGVYPGPAALPDPAEAVRQALESPLDYPPLGRALTPDDRVAIVIDEELPDLVTLLVPILQHIAAAGVAMDSVVLVCADTDPAHPWINDLPDEFGDVHVEDHDPKERRKVAYLATTKAGRRIYLNRTVVEAEQIVVLTGRRFDPLLGHGGAEGLLYPRLSDEATRVALSELATRDDPREAPASVRDEASEVSWLLGQPFYVQLIHAAGDGIAGVIAGANDSTQAGSDQLDAAWIAQLPRLADTVVVSLTGDPARVTFADLARAAHTASRIVQAAGRVVLLCDSAPALAPSVERLVRGEEPDDLLRALRKSDRPEDLPAIHWARAVSSARVSVWSRLAPGLVEDLGATPIDSLAQVQRLVSAGEHVAILEDGHRWLAEIEG